MESENNEVDGMKKGVDSKGEVINFHLHFRQNGFSKEDKILIKIYNS